MTVRLALIRQRYTPYGGAERFIERALHALNHEDMDLTVIARDWPENTALPFRRVLVKSFALGRTWRDWAFSRAACDAVARGSYDLVQSHERLSCCDVYRAGDGVHREWLFQRARVRGPLARLSDMASVFHRRLLRAEASLYRSERLKMVICNSDMVRREIIRHYSVPETKLTVIPNGVDTNVFHPRLRVLHRDVQRRRLGLPVDALVFLFVGSGFERKGVPLLVRIWSHMPAHCHLVVVGRDRHLTAYGNKANTRIHFVGPQGDMPPWYGMADAFVLPTLYDPFPNAALEAAASGLPVLTSNKCGAVELVREGETGDWRDALDEEGWLGMLTAWSDLERCLTVREQARATAEPYDLVNLERHYRTLYSRLLMEAR